MPLDLYRDLLPPETHIYIQRGFNGPITHECLQYDHWCLKQAITNPRLALNYLQNLYDIFIYSTEEEYGEHR